ncbi:unnamed protein product [Cladocopium goreaui]|uniref:Transmembrane protein n=1 Tax=Cladocopium goreaui TaxID=2562237 RepID=A0A9P1D9Y8_9DINO|nr:unnamed protein product [Cladocopium goreaui]
MMRSSQSSLQERSERQSSGHREAGEAGFAAPVAPVLSASSTGRGGAERYLSREGQEILRWALPAVALLVGLFVEHVGLYLATRSYVRWMDELHRPHTDSMSFAYEGADATKGVGSDLGFLVMVLEVFMDLLPVVCIGLVLRFGDLRLWCHTMLVSALLMVLKGFASWATVVPDKGWKVCQARLGLDGLRYYREDQPLVEMIPDMILLEVQGLWLGSSRQRLCVVSAPFDGSICLCTIFCIGLCEVSLAWSAREAEVPAMAQCLRYMLLVLLVASALFTGSGPETTAFKVLGIVLAGAAYGNPALALAVEAWSRHTEPEVKASGVGGPSVMTSFSSALSPNSSVALVGTRRQISELGEEGAGDVGKVFMLPATARHCYMQQYPQESSLLQKKALLQQLLKAMHKAQEQLGRREQKKSELLKKEQADELLSARRADRFAEQRMQEALSDQQRMLNSRAKKKKHQTLNFQERGNAQLLKNTLRACKSLSEI